MIVRWVVGVALLFGVLLLLLPKSDKESLTKIGSASMLMCSLDFREQVAQHVIRKEIVASAFKNTCPDLIASLRVGEQGDMVITGNKYPVKMTLIPVVEGDTVRWSCRGEPADAVTKLCKP
jgi:hypothetical protein